MLIPARRKKILEVFMDAPFREIHLREIARLSKVSLNNVNNFLRLFVKEGMFKKRKISNMTFFRPDLSNEALLKVFEYLEIERRKTFYERNKKIARLLRKYTEDLLALSGRRIQMVILFGSVARGEWARGSDIDILAVVADRSEGLTNIFIKASHDVSPLLEVRPVSTTIDKFVAGFKSRSEFYGELWKDRVVLYNEFLFWQLIKEGEKSGA